MGSKEAALVKRAGRVPNTDPSGRARPTHVTTDEPMDSASAARYRYELPALPTHRVTVPRDRIRTLQTAPNGRALTSGGGAQAATEQEILIYPEEIISLGP